MTDVVKEDIKNNFFDIPESYKQVWEHERFSLMSSSQPEISRERSEGRLTDNDVKIVSFLKEAKFATPDQISRATAIPLDLLLGSSDSRKNPGILTNLFKGLIVNRFVLSSLMSRDSLEEKGSLKIYTLDFGGDYLLSYEGVDMTNWRPSEYLTSTTVVKKALQQVEILIGLKKSKNELRNYEQFKVYRVGNDEVKTDFIASLYNPEVPGDIKSIIGYLIEPGYEDLKFRDDIDLLDQVFNKTQAWKRYYPNQNILAMKLLLIIQDAKNINQIKAVAQVLANTTEFEGVTVNIVGYNDVVTNGLSGSQAFTFIKKENNGKTEISLGKISMSYLK